MAPRKGESLSAQDLEVLESAAQVEDAEDIDIDAWLTDQAASSKDIGHVVIDGKRIPIAMVSEGEENRLIKQSRRPDPRNPRGEMKVDMLAYRRAYVAFSLSKATGRAIPSEDQRILDMPPGTITKLMTEIQRLSKYDIPERTQDPLSLLG